MDLRKPHCWAYASVSSNDKGIESVTKLRWMLQAIQLAEKDNNRI